MRKISRARNPGSQESASGGEGGGEWDGDRRQREAAAGELQRFDAEDVAGDPGGPGGVEELVLGADDRGEPAVGPLVERAGVSAGGPELGAGLWRCPSA